MKAFKQRLEQALGSGAALALLTLPACGGVSTEQTTGNAGAPGAIAGAPHPSAGAPGASGGETSGAPGVSGGSQGVEEAAGTAGTAGTAGAAGASSPELTPYPVSALGCSGPSYDDGFGYHGQCCSEAVCFTPESGGECQSPEALVTGYGSGSCLCGTVPIQGPFAPNPAHRPATADKCCYVISSIGCDGRPLLVNGTPLVAELTQRCDWLLGELLEILA